MREKRSQKLGWVGKEVTLEVFRPRTEHMAEVRAHNEAVATNISEDLCSRVERNKIQV